MRTARDRASETDHDVVESLMDESRGLSKDPELGRSPTTLLAIDLHHVHLE